MLFDTFLNRFELRTGCYVVGMLNMAFIILSLHMPLMTDVYDLFGFLMVIQKYLEMSLTMLLIYAIFSKKRKILLVWQLVVPFIFLFNASYFIYASCTREDLGLLTLWVMSMYLCTYSLMLINSYYDELGFSEMYQNRLMSTVEDRDFEFQIHREQSGPVESYDSTFTDYSRGRLKERQRRTLKRYDESIEDETVVQEEYSEIEEDSAEEERKYMERISTNPPPRDSSSDDNNSRDRHFMRQEGTMTPQVSSRTSKATISKPEK